MKFVTFNFTQLKVVFRGCNITVYGLLFITVTEPSMIILRCYYNSLSGRLN